MITSAHRADLVALEQERTLLSQALLDRQNRLLRETEYFVGAQDASNRLWERLDPIWITQQIGMRFEKQAGSTMVLILDRASDFVHVLSGASGEYGNLDAARVVQEIGPLLKRLSPPPRPGTLPLRGTLDGEAPVTGAVEIIPIGGNPAVVA
ncbi:MAG: hypothetical protein J0H62_02300, partial [Rhizobiales bacterium]|nr:hypothetical protein [Hyphomicrobiales bacterium]